MKAIRLFIQLTAIILVAAAVVSGQGLDTVVLSVKSEINFAGLGLPQKVLQDQLGRPYCYVAAKEGGLRIYGIDEISSPVFKKVIPVTNLEGHEVMNACQVGDYLYLALGNFFNGDNKPGMAIIDIHDPENAFATDVWSWDVPGKGCAFVTVSGNYAFLGAMTQGLLILNTAQKDSITFVSQYIPDIHFPVQNPNAIQMPNARGMAVRDDEVFLCYDAGGLRVIDISDIEQPVEKGRYINPLALGKQQAYNNIALNNDTAYVAADYCGLEILHISDPEDISGISWWNPWDCQSQANAWVNSPGHANQLDFDPAHHLVFLSTGRSELNITDVSDPAAPRQIGTYGTPSDNYLTWGATQAGERIYLAYINPLFPIFGIWSGVKILEWEKTTGIREPAPVITLKAFPNPFHGQLCLTFDLARSEELKIQLFNFAGVMIEELANKRFDAGNHRLYAAPRIPAGVYQVHITSETGSQELVVVKN